MDLPEIQNHLHPLLDAALISEGHYEALSALAAVRLESEKEGLLPECYGAGLNVYPSRMSRSMGAGMKAYRMTMGKQALTENLVSIFITGPDVQPAKVADQEAYFSTWLKSLGGK